MTKGGEERILKCKEIFLLNKSGLLMNFICHIFAMIELMGSFKCITFIHPTLLKL